MSTHKHIDIFCCAALFATLVLTFIFLNAGHLAAGQTATTAEYEDKLFDTSKVHSINIIMDDWDDFTANCQNEEYENCTVVIDNETYQNVAIRGKGNTSLTQVASYGNNRYSFKIEFDHYDRANTYYGLDKLCLNNLINDNTCMKDYLTYQMMNQFRVAAPLCSYVYITVNGEDWGLYLAVEDVEDSFLQRNYGSSYGELYKPDSQDMGNASKGGNQRSNEDVLLKYIDDQIESYPNIFDHAKTNASDADKKRLIRSLKNLSRQTDLEQTVAIDPVIRYFVVHNFVLNFDSYTGSMIHNYYLYENDGQLQMIPWDYNLAFGGFESMGSATDLVNYPIDSPVSGGDTKDRPMIAWIFDHDEYKERYHQYFSELITQYFTNGFFEKMIGQVNSLISPYVKKDPTSFCTYEEFTTGISTLKKFCLLRAESIKDQLDGTIGSASDTQNSATLIDASGISIRDMGSMNSSGKEDGNMPSPGQTPGQNSRENSGEKPDRNEKDNGLKPQMPETNMPPDERQPVSSNDPASVSSCLLLTVSAIVLAFGIVFALLYKRRR